MKTKSKKPILGIVTLLSLLVMTAAFVCGNPGVTVISGAVFLASLVIYTNRFIGGCESSIVGDCA